MPSIQKFSMLPKGELFFISHSGEPHRLRRNQLFNFYPEARELIGRNRTSFAWICFLVLTQFVIAMKVGAFSIPRILVIAFIFGSLIDHGLFILIHECTHNLVFATTRLNKIAALLANVPMLFPLSMGYRRYHLQHHQHKGDPSRDGDIPSLLEVRLVGQSSIRKILWLSFFFLAEGLVRPLRFENKVELLEAWVRENIIFQIFITGLLIGFAPKSAVYLILSSCFALGLNPLCGRFLQEHSLFNLNQETYSYYGFCNLLMFNAGYHNEHHDIPSIPWNKLPQLRKIAPELYEPLAFHTSYFRLLFAFVFDSQFNVFARVVRESKKNRIEDLVHGDKISKATTASAPPSKLQITFHC